MLGIPARTTRRWPFDSWLTPALFGLFLASCLLTSPAQGASQLGLGPGIANVLDSDPLAFGVVELRSPFRYRSLAPWFSLEGTTKESFFGVGVLMDLPLGRRLTFTPSFGGGLYSGSGGVNLGHDLEFRSTAELSHRFADDLRLGISFGHFSNAGFGKRNPGTEVLKLVVLVPLQLQ